MEAKNQNAYMFTKLEALRGVAACFVVLYHSEYFFSQELVGSTMRFFSDRSVRFVSNAYLFVDFFFIISGFVMSFAYSNKIKSGLTLRSYVILRLGRIYPLHIFMLFVFVAYTALKVYLHSKGMAPEPELNKNNINTFVSNILLLHSLGLHQHLSWNLPSWSISVEFYTYIIFFIFTKYLDTKESMFVPLFISIIAFCSLLIIGEPDLEITKDYGIIRCIASFYLGIFLLRLKLKIDQHQFNINIAELLSVLFVALSVCFAHKGWLFQLMTIISFFTLLYVYSNEQSGYLGGLLKTAPMRAVGLWSYSIYLLHFFLLSISYVFMKVIFKVSQDQIVGINAVVMNIVILLITILISRFTYIHIEARMRQKVKLFIAHKSKS